MHYVCSDIHGHYDYFTEILNIIGFGANDIMYVVGDVIDKGPDSIRLLQFIMEQPNIRMMIGNHEHMMLGAELLNSEKQFSRWMYNSGANTKDQLDEMPEEERKSLLQKLYESPVIIPRVEVGGRNYYLVHACHALTPVHEEVRYCDLEEEDAEEIVWSREYQEPDKKVQGKRFRELYAAHPNTTMIIGHTPVFKCSYGVISKDWRPRISRSCSGHLINLDCGCARGLPLGCLRLEDGEEFYSSLPPDMRIVMR